MLIQPRVSPQEPPEQNRRSGSSSNQAAPRKETNPNQPTLRATRQQMLKTPSQPIPTVRPEQNAATARPIENVHTPIRSSQMNASVCHLRLALYGCPVIYAFHSGLDNRTKPGTFSSHLQRLLVAIMPI